ncbi:MAG: hypothetical protein ACE5FT_00965 [Candidatus Nanoarchaeia archaeon]
MKYSVTITIEGKKLYEYLKGDMREQTRSHMKLEETPEGVKITIEAKDAVAFRSCLNTVGQAMAVWEQL